MLDVASVKAGETVVISGAAEATEMGGKPDFRDHRRGVRYHFGRDCGHVYHKCTFLKEELGFDVTISYKNDDWK
jgi:NADPH-dependent curcumin reductase CurA